MKGSFLLRIVDKANNPPCQGRVNDFQPNFNVNKLPLENAEFGENHFIRNRHSQFTLHSMAPGAVADIFEGFPDANHVFHR